MIVSMLRDIDKQQMRWESEKEDENQRGGIIRHRDIDTITDGAPFSSISPAYTKGLNRITTVKAV